MSVSVLGKARSADVAMRPFPHLVLDGVMANATYRKMAAAFPSPERFVKGMEVIANNQAVRIAARDIVGNDSFSPEWQEFFRYHTSKEFWADICRVLGDAIRHEHPGIEARAGKRLEDWKVTRRGEEEPGYDVSLDALFVVNTPVKVPSSVRPAHVDSEDEIWAGLFYMKPEDDPTPGGDLALYSFKTGRPAFGGHYAPLSDVKEDRVVGYTANRFASFVNSPNSIHGVTPRPVTESYRRYINFVAHTPYKAFSLPKLSPLKQLTFWLERRKTKSAGRRAAGGY
jgi:hypothetical protein